MTDETIAELLAVLGRRFWRATDGDLAEEGALVPAADDPVWLDWWIDDDHGFQPVWTTTREQKTGRVSVKGIVHKCNDPNCERTKGEPPMAIYARASTFEIPTEGWHEGILRQVRDLGECDWADGKYMVELVFEVAERDSRGERFEVAHSYNNTLNEAARLRIDLEAGLDRALTDDELAGSLDLEKLVGARFGIRVGHRKSQRGGTFSDVKALRPAGGGKTAGVAADTDDDAGDSDMPF